MARERTEPDTWQTAIAALDVPDSLKEILGSVTAEFAAFSGDALERPPRPTAPRATALVPEPYVDLGRIGAGGMGEVRRARDPRLDRTLAIKTLHPRLADDVAARARFLDEARVTAQLQHPAIPPVHEVGHLPDGRPYFAMLEVRGETLGAAIDALHDRDDGPDPGGLRRLLSAVQRVAQAVAYAHSLGVVHRDLKPDNIMLGPFGEVWVLDWGLTRVDGEARVADLDRITLARGADLSRAGSVRGTPAYMAPEQARAEAVDARADVYALGGLLYAVLTARAPHQGDDVVAVLRALAVATSPPSPAETAQWAVPPELDALCRSAMEPERTRRMPTADALGGELGAWLEGARARDRALALVSRADADLVRARELAAEADVRLDTADRALATLPAGDEEALWPWWDIADSAEAQRLEAERVRVRAVLRLESALTHAPELPEAHDRLAAHHAAAHAEAEGAGDHRAADRHAAWLEEHGGPAWASYLRGRGALTLVCDPPAQVRLSRLEERHRRLVPTSSRDLGLTPLAEVALDRGSYVARLTAPGRDPVDYPFVIGRGEHWSGVRPGDREAYPVTLPAAGALDDAERLVPAGWFLAGRAHPMDDDQQVLQPTRVWRDAFVVARDPVTNDAYLAYLNALVDEGREEEATRRAPRYTGAHGGPVWRRDSDGRFLLGRDAQGDLWFPEAPVVLIDWDSATAYAAWAADRSGKAWRLGWELEWEKAARGVDGRPYPWGQRFHPGWCRMRASSWPTPGPAPVSAFPADQSVYGIRGLAGNVLEWLADPEPGFAPVVDGIAVAPDVGAGTSRRRLRGGAYLYRAFNCRVDGPGSGLVDVRLDYQGFRLFRSWS